MNKASEEILINDVSEVEVRIRAARAAFFFLRRFHR
jgi:hypothetical protein